MLEQSFAELFRGKIQSRTVQYRTLLRHVHSQMGRDAWLSFADGGVEYRAAVRGEDVGVRARVLGEEVVHLDARAARVDHDIPAAICQRGEGTCA